MKRHEMVQRIHTESTPWDLLIIGGGATGLGAAVDAAARGLKVLLLEKGDFAEGTSSRSTKLIHGGLRYLKQGNLKLVMEALKERGRLCKNGPHLVKPLPFIVPNYQFWEAPFYAIGVKLYDFLAGDLRMEESRHIKKKELLTLLPTLDTTALRSGTLYYDGQFDDARLAITLAQTAATLGATLLNYMPVTRLLKEQGIVTGVEAQDRETEELISLRAKVVINATGVFADTLRALDDPTSPPILAPSQGTHLVFPGSFMPGKTALLIPKTEDGRVLFFVPWHRHLLVGTTDTPVDQASSRPHPTQKEIDFLLHHIQRYLFPAPERKDIIAVFSGLRPLMSLQKTAHTALVSREHAILVSPSRLITIVGGKWTTYRKMAEDVINQALKIGGFAPRSCTTEALPLHGYEEKPTHPLNAWDSYGSDRKKLQMLLEVHPEWSKPLHPRLPYLPVEIIWAVREEMARTLEDVLARRTRSLFLDTKASLEIAPYVAELMAQELGYNASWIRKEITTLDEYRATLL